LDVATPAAPEEFTTWTRTWLVGRPGGVVVVVLDVEVDDVELGMTLTSRPALASSLFDLARAITAPTTTRISTGPATTAVRLRHDHTTGGRPRAARDAARRLVIHSRTKSKSTRARPTIATIPSHAMSVPLPPGISGRVSSRRFDGPATIVAVSRHTGGGPGVGSGS